MIFDKTPFYAERGGQVADHGDIYDQEGNLVARVVDVQHAPNDQNLHFVDVVLPLVKGQTYKLKIDRRAGKASATPTLLPTSCTLLCGKFWVNTPTSRVSC